MQTSHCAPPVGAHVSSEPSSAEGPDVPLAHATRSDTVPGLASDSDVNALGVLTLDQRIGLWKALSELGEKEADRLWQRYTIMLSLNGFLLAVSTYALANKLAGAAVVVSIAGVCIAFVWYRIMRLSQFYEARWRQDADALLRADGLLSRIILARSSPRIPSPEGSTSTDYARRVVPIVGLMWLAIGVYAALRSAGV